MTHPRTQSVHRTPSALLCFALCWVGGVGCQGPKLQEPTPDLDILQLLPASGTLQVGQTASLGALRLQHGQSVNVTSTVSWTSDDASVASVAYDPQQGAVLTGIAPGTAQITATGGGVSARAQFVISAQVTAIELDKGLVELGSGTSLPLHATLISADGTKSALSGPAAWGSSDIAVASVDAQGVVQGLAPADAVISVTYAGLATFQAVHVRPWSLQSVTAAALAGTTLPIGASSEVEVTGLFTGGHTQDITSLFELGGGDAPDAAPGDSPLLTFDAASVIAGTLPGTATVTGTGKPGSIVADRSFSLDFTVSDAPLSSLDLDAPASLSTQGEPAAFVLTGIYDDGLRFETHAQFTTDPEGIVYVDGASATIMALGPGMVTITASVPASDPDGAQAAPPIEVSKSLQVVDDAISALNIMQDPDAAALPLAVDGTIQLSATAAFGALDSEDVTSAALWTSSDERVAVVSNVRSGLVTAIGPGSAAITTTYKGHAATFVTAVAAAH